jgi:hypothetical protein
VSVRVCARVRVLSARVCPTDASERARAPSKARRPSVQHIMISNVIESATAGGEVDRVGPAACLGRVDSRKGLTPPQWPASVACDPRTAAIRAPETAAWF